MINFFLVLGALTLLVVLFAIAYLLVLVTLVVFPFLKAQYAVEETLPFARQLSHEKLDDISNDSGVPLEDFRPSTKVPLNVKFQESPDEFEERINE